MDEHLANGPGQAFVHGETLPFPVAGCAESLQLSDYLAPRFSLPLPDPFHKIFPAEFVPVFSFRSKLSLHDILCGYSSMVSPWHPKNVKSAHSFPPAKNILQCIIEGMAHVQDPG